MYSSLDIASMQPENCVIPQGSDCRNDGVFNMNSKVNRLFIIAIAPISIASIAALSGCAATPSASESTTENEAVSLTNCGHKLEIQSTPESVVTIKSTPLELLLALDLEDKISGSAFLDGPVPESLAPEGWEPNILSDELPSKEVLLDANPDLVFAGWESNLSADGIGDRSDLETLGIQAYVSPPACEFGSEDQGPVTFDDVFDMFSEVGEIFDVSDRAAELISSQEEQLDSIEAPDETSTALWFSSGSDTPFVGGGAGVPNMIMEAAGLENVAASEEQSWFGMPWETFVSSDPDFIVLVDAPWNSAADKRELLEKHPAANKMRAVEDGKFIVVDFSTTEAGVRNIEAVQTIADSLSNFSGGQGDQ